MLKTSDTNKQIEQNQTSSSILHRTFTLLTTIVVLVGVGGGIYFSREFFREKSVQPSQPDPEIVRLTDRLNILQNRLDVLEKDNSGKISGRELAVLNESIDSKMRLNREILDSKAGNNALLGLINRVDILETRVSGLGKVTSDGALILTAAMLVKDAAASGDSFEYEAEVLRQLAMETDLAPQTEVIARYAPEGIPCRKKLIVEFNRLYNAAHLTETSAEDHTEVKEEKSADWKDKINRKLSQLITIKYHNADGEVVEKNIPEDEVYALVNDGRFDAAIIKMNEDPLYRSEAFKNWQNSVNAKTEFNRALKRIQAVTLAAMKVEHLKKAEE